MHIIIPMSGVGQRFIDAGYAVPKPLIVVDGKPMIQHVIDLTPGENKITFICNHTHLTTTNMREQLLAIVPDGNIVEIPDHTLGPVYTVLQVIDHIDDDEEIIINHCDFGTYWDYDDFLKHTRDRDADGAIPSYKGFHPHMLGTTNYAFMRDDQQWMLEIKEKEPFTDDRMNEYASNGTYYFKKGSYVKKYFNELMDRNLNVNGEFYISLVYNLLKRDDLKVSIFEIQHMIQWGIPRDVEDYNAWSSYFKEVVNQTSDSLDMDQCDIELIPINFNDSHFLEAGYSEPKPLITVNGRLMVLAAAHFLPIGRDNIFIYEKDSEDISRLKSEISKNYQNFHLHQSEVNTKGVAAMCYDGLKESKKSASLQINATDNGVLFDQKKYLNLLNDEEVDGIVWIHKHYRYSEDHPQKFNWVVTNGETLKHISIKKSVSNTPYFDSIAVGTFYFKKVKYFMEAYEEALKEETLKKDLLSIEEVVNSMISMNLKVKIFEVNRYVSWKTPDELKTYQYWQSFFHKVDWHPYTLGSDVSISKEVAEKLDSEYRSFEQEYR